MTALSTLVESLKRELAVPGQFDETFPVTADSDLIGTLADGFGEAQLWGFFPTLALTPTTVDGEEDWETNAPLSAAGATLVVLFAAARVLRAQIRAFNTMERYKAGPVEVETQRAAGVLKDELDYVTTRISDLIKDAKTRGGVMVTVHDNYYARGGGITEGRFHRFHHYEYKG